MGGIPDQVIDLLGVRPRRITVLKDVPLANASWLVEAADKQPLVLRRYHAGATAEDLAYEHAVLEYLAKVGWVVPAPISKTIERPRAGGSAGSRRRLWPGGCPGDQLRVRNVAVKGGAGDVVERSGYPLGRVASGGQYPQPAIANE
jgi:hypothetical protein